jgi:hypothetical protein
LRVSKTDRDLFALHTASQKLEHFRAYKLDLASLTTSQQAPDRSLALRAPRAVGKELALEMVERTAGSIRTRELGLVRLQTAETLCQRLERARCRAFVLVVQTDQNICPTGDGFDYRDRNRAELVETIYNKRLSLPTTWMLVKGGCGAPFDKIGI